MEERIYFDGAANITPYKSVLEAIQPLYQAGINNPSSLHKEGLKASILIENARKDIAKILNCKKEEIFFVSSASEAIAWVAKMRKILVHPTSHHAVFESNKDCNPKLTEKPVIAIPLYDSETGTRNDLKEFKDNEIFLDLTASIGKEKINLKKMKNVKYACFSAHKFGGIFGAGILYIKKDVQKYIQPLIWGSQENEYRGGTENVPAIVAMAEALKINNKNFGKYKSHIESMVSYLYDNLKDVCKIRYSSNTLNITFDNVTAQFAVLVLDKMGVAISAGSACNSLSVEPSSILIYRGYSRDDALKTIRISLSINNTLDECKKFIKVIKNFIDNYDTV